MSYEKLVRAEELWAFIDLMQKSLDQSLADPEAKTSESVKLIVFGRREMLKNVAEWLFDNQVGFEDFCDSIGYEIRSIDDS